mgnify:CR=1 FL=1
MDGYYQQNLYPQYYGGYQQPGYQQPGYQQIQYPYQQSGYQQLNYQLPTQSLEVTVITPQQKEITKSLDELESKIELSDPVSGTRGSEYMTIKEYTKLIGDRTDNLGKGIGIGPTVIIEDEIDPLNIAIMEMKQRRFPLMLHRTYPDGVMESWNPNNMVLPDGV